MVNYPNFHEGQFGNLQIKELRFSGSGSWRTKHFKSLKMNYGRSKYFQEYREEYKAIYEKDWESFMPFVDAMLKQHLKDLNIATKIVYSSKINAVGQKSELILDICRKLEQIIIFQERWGKTT